jgi:Fe2+ or Zn2+ uptake regulation protein
VSPRELRLTNENDYHNQAAVRRPRRLRQPNGQAVLLGRPVTAQAGALVCDRCGRQVTFADGELERLQDEVARQHGFVLLRRQHQLHGLCTACQRPMTRG